MSFMNYGLLIFNENDFDFLANFLFQEDLLKMFAVLVDLLVLFQHAFYFFQTQKLLL